MATQALKRPQGGTTEFTLPPGIVPPPQVESFVYRSIELAAERHAAAAAKPAVQQEMHSGIHIAMIVCWAALFGVFALTFANSAYTMYMITVAVLNGFMFFAVPIVLNSVNPKTCSVGFGDFLRGKFATFTGPVSGVDALAQVIVVPAALTLGAIVIAFIVHASKITY